MANTMQSCGAIQKTSLHCQALSWQGLEFSKCVSSSSRLCISARNSCRCRGRLRVSCDGARIDVIERKENQNQGVEESEKQLTCVMKFGGSSVASAERMREVAELILSFPNERPVIVLSAMGKTTNKLLLVYMLFICFVFVPIPELFYLYWDPLLVHKAGGKAVTCGVTNTSCIEELGFIRDLHLRWTKRILFWLLLSMDNQDCNLKFFFSIFGINCAGLWLNLELTGQLLQVSISVFPEISCYLFVSSEY